MKQRSRRYFTEPEVLAMWERWHVGESRNSIARDLDRGHSSVQRAPARRGAVACDRSEGADRDCRCRWPNAKRSRAVLLPADRFVRLPAGFAEHHRRSAAKFDVTAAGTAIEPTRQNWLPGIEPGIPRSVNWQSVGTQPTGTCRRHTRQSTRSCSSRPAEH